MDRNSPQHPTEGFQSVTLRWHGYDVPAGDDGVAGVTQDAVPIGGSFVYRFRADQAGTYWYHSHQVADPQVRGGLFGGLVVTPTEGLRDVEGLGNTGDVTAVTHVYEGRRTVNGLEGDVPAEGAPGTRVRVRVVNTDNGPVQTWVGGAPYRLAAIDGHDVNAPTPTTDALSVTAGARADLEIDLPADGAGVRVEIGGASAVTFGRPLPVTPRPARDLDPMHYGAPAALAFDRNDERTALRLLVDGIWGEPLFDRLPPERMHVVTRNAGAMKALTRSTEPFPDLSRLEVATLRMPVLLLNGDRANDLHRRVIDELALVLPGAQREVISGAGHGAPSENPVGFNRVVFWTLLHGGRT